MFGLDTTLTIFLIVCIISAMAFEFINGFHDTANAVATVIYTHSLKPSVAVVWSGLWNFIGVYVGGIAVAMGIVNLLPLDMLIDQNVYHSIAMILSLILTAIIWNIGTWYFGIPCSSSHSLIGSIFGVGIAYSYLPEAAHVALNWAKVKDVGLSLLISPVIGFSLALLLMYLLKKLIKNKEMFKEPDSSNPPPFLMRSILVLTCTSVSLIMIILIGIIPFQFAINKIDSPVKMMNHVNKIELALTHIDSTKINDETTISYNLIKKNLDTIQSLVKGKTNFNTLKSKQLILIRKSILTSSKSYDALIDTKGILSEDTKKVIHAEIKETQADIKLLQIIAEQNRLNIFL